MKKDNLNASDVTKKAKGIFSKVKHILRDPIKSSAEAIERKKECSMLQYISLASILLPFVFGAILGKFDFPGKNVITGVIGIVAMVGFVCLIFSSILLGSVSNAVKKFKFLECKNCQSRLLYSDEVEYEILREWEVKQTSQQSNSSRVSVTQTQYAEVGFTVKCPKCGEEHALAKEFALEIWHNGERLQTLSIPEVLEDYFADVVPLSFGTKKKSKQK